MNLQQASESFFDEPYSGGSGPGPAVAHATCVRQTAEGARAVGSLATRYLVAVLAQRCHDELADCLEPHERALETGAIHVERSGAVPGPGLRLTGWVEQLADDAVTWRVRARDEHDRVCEATIELRTVAARATATVGEAGQRQRRAA
ncbi:MAG: hypothetical protein ABI641_14500 [Caldimonas sp.]